MVDALETETLGGAVARCNVTVARLDPVSNFIQSHVLEPAR
eukprot:SAG11_NODE_23709_length_384_cov_0.831579_2_plen_40_part_01